MTEEVEPTEQHPATRDTDKLKHADDLNADAKRRSTSTKRQDLFYIMSMRKLTQLTEGESVCVYKTQGGGLLWT